MICNYYPMQEAFVPISEQQTISRTNYILYEPASSLLQAHSNTSSSQVSMSNENLPKPKQKRTRTAFTGYQLIELEREFKRNMYMFRHHRIHVAQRLALRESQVKVWFQNRRMRHKKETRGLQEKKSTSKSTGSHSETNAHQEIVQRLMSYSQDPLSKHPKISINYTDKSRSLKSAIHTQLCLPIQKSIIPPNNPRSNDFSDIIDFLEGNALQQTPRITPPRTPYPNDLDIVLQSINNDLDVLPPALRSQW